jgi:hypothetical protein
MIEGRHPQQLAADIVAAFELLHGEPEAAGR